MKKRIWLKYLVIFLTVLVCTVCALTAYLEKIVFPRGAEVLHSYAEDDMFEIFHSSVSEVMDKYGKKYESLFNFSCNADGSVNSVSANYYAVNKIKSEIALLVSEKLNLADGREVCVPLGAFSNNMFFMGKGPKLKFRLVQRGCIQTDFEHSFEGSGVNQVMHTLKIRLNADIALMLPFYNTHTFMETSAVLAQIIINGETPRQYLDITKEENNR